MEFVIKGLVGGLTVVAFSILGKVIRPRGLAGITSGAPSVAIAGLAITVVLKGTSSAHAQALGMIMGAFALVAWCLVGDESIKRFGALKGALAATPVWFVTAFGLWSAILR